MPVLDIAVFLIIPRLMVLKKLFSLFLAGRADKVQKKEEQGANMHNFQASSPETLSKIFNFQSLSLNETSTTTLDDMILIRS